MYVFRGLLSLLAISFLFSTLSATAQSAAEDQLRKQQHWQIKCMPKGCIGSVDVLRGQSDDPPDAHDVNQYISVAVGVDRKDQRPSAVMFEVDPNADKSVGVLLSFAHTVPDGKNWKVVMDEGGPVHLQFTRCDQTECIASVGGGIPDETAMKSCTYLVRQMQMDDHLFLTYLRGGHAYRTAVSLKLFKEAYQQLLTELSASSSSAKP